MRGDDVVGIDEHEEVADSARQPYVACGPRTRVRLPDCMESSVGMGMLLEHCRTLVVRTVVDADHLEVAMRLAPNGLQARIHVPSRVVHRDDHADEGHGLLSDVSASVDVDLSDESTQAHP
jgi:hypothetical protein